MPKGLIQHIGEIFKSYTAKVLLVENNDRFLYRKDIMEAFVSLGIEITNGSGLEQRIKFELRDSDGILVLISQNNADYPEDIISNSEVLEFSLGDHLPAYHIPSIIGLDLSILNKLLDNNLVVKLNKIETLQCIKRLQSDPSINHEQHLNLDEFVSELNSLLNVEIINWAVVGRLIAEGILKTIGTSQFDVLYTLINNANEVFQKTLHTDYHQIKNSNAIKKPRIVTKILDFLDFNYQMDKVALIVIDGMALWQYELIRKELSDIKREEVIYSWLPSITQLSRQAIFRGDTPRIEYLQKPISEEKLWKQFWESKGCQRSEVKYFFDDLSKLNLDLVSKIAFVFNDLDEKMHNSSDYIDLLSLTKNWISHGKLKKVVEKLIENKFKVFITTDHGNVQARGWRNLNGREKLGTNKSGSRSERHIEYSERWLAADFIENNPEIQQFGFIDEQAIYLKTDLSFSDKESLVTHGGSHLLEVLIPFIEISYEP